MITICGGFNGNNFNFIIIIIVISMRVVAAVAFLIINGHASTVVIVMASIVITTVEVNFNRCIVRSVSFWADVHPSCKFNFDWYVYVYQRHVFGIL